MLTPETYVENDKNGDLVVKAVRYGFESNSGMQLSYWMHTNGKASSWHSSMGGEPEVVMLTLPDNSIEHYHIGDWAVLENGEFTKYSDEEFRKKYVDKR